MLDDETEDLFPVAVVTDERFLPDRLGDLVSLACLGGDGEKTVTVWPGWLDKLLSGRHAEGPIKQHIKRRNRQLELYIRPNHIPENL